MISDNLKQRKTSEEREVMNCLWTWTKISDNLKQRKTSKKKEVMNHLWTWVSMPSVLQLSSVQKRSDKQIHGSWLCILASSTEKNVSINQKECDKTLLYYVVHQVKRVYKWNAKYPCASIRYYLRVWSSYLSKPYSSELWCQNHMKKAW